MITELHIPKTLQEAIPYFADPDVAHCFLATFRKRVAQTPKTEFQKAEAERKMRKAAEKGTRKE